jgi:hypothetical protein
MFINFKHRVNLLKLSKDREIISQFSKLFKYSLRSFCENTKNNNTKDEEKYFYDKNLENAINSNKMISVKKDPKMRSKLSLNEPTEQPLIENEAYRELYRNFLYILAKKLLRSLTQ